MLLLFSEFLYDYFKLQFAQSSFIDQDGEIIVWKGLLQNLFNILHEDEIHGFLQNEEDQREKEN